MRKKMLYVILVLNGIAMFLYTNLTFTPPEIIKVEIKKEINEQEKKNVVIYLNNKSHLGSKCAVDNNEWIKSKFNKCSFYLSSGKHTIKVKNYKKEVKKIVNVEINEIKSITLKAKEIYLAVGENKKIESVIEKIGNPNYKVNFSSSNEKIATIDDNGIVNGNSVGEVNINVSVSNYKKSVKVIVTDLIIPMTLDMNKPVLPCGIYSDEDNELIDKILESRVQQKGEGTRAALIETIRFLPLSFKYKIPYFFENGRLNPYGNQHYVDGEGRYYNKGLYLSDSKKSKIRKSFAGPATWGCPLTNYDTSYGWAFGGKYPNGLDCSGFVTWALYNSGLDIGDIGSGITDSVDDVSDLGEIHELTYEYANSDDYKVGDIIARDGHTALIAGKDDENIYIAESLLKGVVIETFSYKDRNSKLYKLYGYIGKLDNIYKYDGEYNDMW